MFTSRAEYRLVLREDNADLRLRRFGYGLGLIRKEDYDIVLEKGRLIKEEINRLKKEKLDKILRRPTVTYSSLCKDTSFSVGIPEDVEKQVEIEIKYEGFIQRQLRDVEKFKKIENIRLPEDFDFSKVAGLSNEVKEKLGYYRPHSLGQASRISGITPVAISILMVYLHGHGQKTKLSETKKTGS